MDIHSLDHAVRSYYSAGLAKSTHKTYSVAEKRYVAFCEAFNLKPFPTSESTLCYFVACTGQEGLAHSTIKTYLSGIRQTQISLGLPDPHVESLPRLQQIIRGIKVVRGQEGKASRSRLPITPQILKQMQVVLNNRGNSFDNVMLWAACTTTFFSFCRSGEVTTNPPGSYDPNTHLSYGNLSVDNADSPKVLALQLKVSKTDQGRRGVKVVIGKTGDALCPVTAMLRYLRLRGSHSGPLFIWQNKTPLSRAALVSAVRAILIEANLPADKFAGHSFRIGAASTAAAAGIQDSQIQTLGRWKSSAYLLYVRTDPQELASISRLLSSCHI